MENVKCDFEDGAKRKKGLKIEEMNWHGIKGREMWQRNKRTGICSLVLYQCEYEDVSGVSHLL